MFLALFNTAQSLLQTLTCWDQACCRIERLIFIICLVASVWWCLVCAFPIPPGDLILKLWHEYIMDVVCYTLHYIKRHISNLLLDYNENNLIHSLYVFSPCKVICIVLPWYYKIIWLPINQFIKLLIPTQISNFIWMFLLVSVSYFVSLYLFIFEQGELGPEFFLT